MKNNFEESKTHVYKNILRYIEVYGMCKKLWIYGWNYRFYSEIVDHLRIL